MSIYPIINYSQKNAGKITITTLVLCFLALSVFVVVDTQYRGVNAEDTATTSVTVINSPPVWMDGEGPREVPDSSSSTPTNEVADMVWEATARDPNVETVGDGNDYWLLICKGTPDGVTEEDFDLFDGGTSKPDCPEGNTWARSSEVADGEVATATYDIDEGRIADAPNEDEVNDWYAVICDDDADNPRCNADDLRIGPDEDSSIDDAESSPFYVNYRPKFTGFDQPSGTNPGDMATWTSTAEDINTELSESAVKLFICRENDFDEEEQSCGAGGTYATSSLVASNPSASYEVPVPKPDGEYDAYGFVVDSYGLAAPTDSAYEETKRHGENRKLPVNNVEPVLESDTVSFYDVGAGSAGGPFTITELGGLTEGFKVEFETADDNSCVTKDWTEGSTTTNYEEMSDVAMNFYRSGIGMENCVNDEDYDSSSCYPYEVDQSFEGDDPWDVTCTMDQSSCSGNEDRTVEWECTFSLWYNADPTDDNAQFSSEDWKLSANVTDNDDETGDRSESESGVELDSALGFALDQNAIPYGELNVGESSDLNSLTPILATGNTGVDQELEGTPMCPGFDLGATNYGCTDYEAGEVPSDTIPARFQKFGQSGTGYEDAGATELADRHLGESAELYEVNVPKTIDPLDPGEEDIGWGMEIPSDIVTADDYQGENLFTGIMSDSSNW